MFRIRYTQLEQCLKVPSSCCISKQWIDFDVFMDLQYSWMTDKRGKCMRVMTERLALAAHDSPSLWWKCVSDRLRRHFIQKMELAFNGLALSKCAICYTYPWSKCNQIFCMRISKRRSAQVVKADAIVSAKMPNIREYDGHPNDAQRATPPRTWRRSNWAGSRNVAGDGEMAAKCLPGWNKNSLSKHSHN